MKPEILLEALASGETLHLSEWICLLEAQSPELMALAAEKADAVRRRIYGTKIFTRGLIEISNYCRNDCLYCGIRKSNPNCERYQLSKAQILECCADGYALGFRTFVLQGGEGVVPITEICDLVQSIKQKYPDCAVTLSLGEYETEAYRAMYNAGADRYLLRHETADAAHYAKLHPKELSWENRMRCLRDLKAIGFQVGCGFMVGSPYQTIQHLAKEMVFIQEFQPDMCGIGPFIPQKDTPFGEMPAGTAEQTIYLISLLRLLQPNVLLPATTALGTIAPDGRERGILAGANVVMPNLSPVSVRKKYALYDNKICTGEESAQCRTCLNRRMDSIGFALAVDRGDIRK